MRTSSKNGNLTLQPAGVEHIIDVSKKRNIPLALRLTVDSGGCGGFQYYFDLVPADSATATDNKVEADDGSVVMLVDALSESYLDNCKVDFVEEMIGSKFVVSENKLAESACSCGASFNVGF
ncbi:Protein hesB, putative [Perkinsus marinus ATCC 50983]|uniref:Protein hesB, putative n=1 Tax=Perkinsus marinus (strain ATCC 50983 / TXsc) TaxID=423536 RepID=C5K7K3_PERM5|nr:Protein hesB, putative [Perkinsus marinus ATCC 50983]EER19538.1 Protein hesB, putative [Perkinsus marinus ATCC 50983]|eukprot:XP_002787742.1 Protein hesB, putative [Perkinsus marinus ATCC 50983]